MTNEKAVERKEKFFHVSISILYFFNYFLAELFFSFSISIRISDSNKCEDIGWKIFDSFESIY